MADVLEKRADLKDPTPMMQQYFAVKDEYPDYILFYRLGDFYEMFFEDAITASRVLELTLTGRDCGEGRRAAMCGVPFHKADVYLGRLVEAGFKVAVCEQTEDPALAKGLVRREVIRVVTPGTITDGSLLSEGQHNYLAAAPSIETIVTSNGICLPLRSTALRAACSSPPQQGTSMRSTVTLRISLRLRISVSLSA